MHTLLEIPTCLQRAQHGRSRKTYRPFALCIALLIWMISNDVQAAQAQNPKPRATPTTRVDVNSADLQLLETLPGVGPVLAQRILEQRPYKDLADLEKVKGLGPSKIEGLKSVVTFGPALNTNRMNSAISAGTSPGVPATKAPSQKAAGSVQEQPTGHGTSTNAPGKLEKGEKININRATAADLERLPGIGPAKAKAILDYRTRNGEFKTIEDVQKVNGIKAGAFARIRHVIKVTD
jgi:competence protein ComEA